MPTNPLQSILYRELSRAADHEVIAIVSPLLQELVNYATNALARCATSIRGGEDEHLAPLALYRHIIEMTDGIEVLLAQSCALPAIPVLRSSFESLLAVEYILEEDEVYSRRSLSWFVSYNHKRIDLYERLDPATPKGREFKKNIDDDKILSNITLPSEIEAQKRKANLVTMLAKPHLAPIESEYQRCKDKRKNFEWYYLFEGLVSIRNLAQHLKRGAQYDTLYRQWSTTAHAQDLQPFFDITSTHEAAIKRLRNPGQIKEVVSLTSAFILDATRLMLLKFRPGEEESFGSWYIKEVRERYLYITKSRSSSH